LLLAILWITAVSAIAQTSAPASREISVDVVVTDDQGALAIGLERGWFSVSEKSTQLQITTFEVHDKPASIVFLFDLSASIGPSSKNSATAAAYDFVKTHNVDNEYLIIGFHKAIVAIYDWDRDQQNIQRSLIEIANHTPKHETALYEACSVALKKLESAHNSNQVLVLFSDGLDTVSEFSLKALREELKKSAATVYSVAAFNDRNMGIPLGMEGHDTLEELASVSGGRAFYPRNDQELRNVLANISLELSHRYTIRFSPPLSTPDNKWHPIRIKLTLPPRDEKGLKFRHLNVRARQGYYDL
jgi:Ca-activated chloride channel family protein